MKSIWGQALAFVLSMFYTHTFLGKLMKSRDELSLISTLHCDFLISVIKGTWKVNSHLLSIHSQKKVRYYSILAFSNPLR